MYHGDETNRARDERWGSYPETVLVFGESDVVVDLRESVPDATRDALTAMGLGEPFGILTAFNPRGVDLSAGENSRRMTELENELAAAGDDFVLVDACSPDRAHCECSVAVKGSRERSIELAKRWDQLAIFWWDGSRFWLYGSTIEIEPLPLPL